VTPLTLRHQLAEKQATPVSPTAPTLPRAAANEPTRCFTTAERAPGVKFASDKKTLSFPYSHYLFSELVSDEALAIRFATHRVVVAGQNLEALLDELTSQRLALVRVLPKRQRDQPTASGVWIDRIEVTEVGTPEVAPAAAGSTSGMASNVSLGPAGPGAGQSRPACKAPVVPANAATERAADRD